MAQRSAAHRKLPLTLLAVRTDLPRRNAAHNLGQRQLWQASAAPHAADEGSQERAFVCQTSLVFLGGQATAEASLKVWLPARGSKGR